MRSRSVSFRVSDSLHSLPLGTGDKFSRQTVWLRALEVKRDLGRTTWVSQSAVFRVVTDYLERGL